MAEIKHLYTSQTQPQRQTHSTYAISASMDAMTSRVVALFDRCRSEPLRHVINRSKWHHCPSKQRPPTPQTVWQFYIYLPRLQAVGRGWRRVHKLCHYAPHTHTTQSDNHPVLAVLPNPLSRFPSTFVVRALCSGRNAHANIARNCGHSGYQALLSIAIRYFNVKLTFNSSIRTERNLLAVAKK